MKRIGILTFHNAHNYGAMLQAYALQEILSKENNVEIIDYRNKLIEEQYKLFRTFHKKNIKKSLKNFVGDILKYPMNKKRFKNFNSFMNEKLKLSNRFNTEEQLFENNMNYNIMITGSDQVWNPGIVGSVSDVYTLNFGNAKKISYAASVGNAELIDKNKKEFIRKVSQIDCISVREKDAKEKLSKIIDKPINVVLDPTLLMTKEEWDNKLENCSKENEKYILAYVVEKDEEYIKILNKLSKKTGLKVIHFSKRNYGYNNILRNAYTEGPFEFVNLIKNAEYVVATSFHAAVFSIIFNKKFFIIPHKTTGARVTNILNTLGIENRTYQCLEDFEKIDYDFETDWNSVNNKLEEERKKSIEWLNNSIK